MSTSGTFTTFAPGVAPSTALPDDAFNGLILGSDGNVWYAGFSNVGNITPAGVATNYPLAGIGGICAGAAGDRIARAKDGGLWISVACAVGSQLLHVTTTGVFATSPLPAAFINPQGLVVGKDGNVYIAGSDDGPTSAILQATVSGASVTGTSIVDIANAATDTFGIAQSSGGDLWATNDDCTSTLIRLHLATGFAQSSTSVFHTMAGCVNPAFLVALPDGSLWVPEAGYAERVLPGSSQTAPALFDIALPSPYTDFGTYWDSTIGSDGDLYLTNDNVGIANASSNVVKIAF